MEEDAGWDASTLDCVCFPPMADEHAFGFVNPDDVLRGCHLYHSFHVACNTQMAQVSLIVCKMLQIGTSIMSTSLCSVSPMNA